MNSIQRNIVEFLNDYRHMVENLAKDFEAHGLQTSSWRLKNKLIEIESTMRDFTHSCANEEARNQGQPFKRDFDRRKH